MYCRYLYGGRGYQPLPQAFWERTRTLLALSATCRLMRQVALADTWRAYGMCGGGIVPQVEAKFLSRCETLLGNPHLVAYVR